MHTIYFSPRTFDFLRQLKTHNNRSWFIDHKADYLTHVQAPFLDLIGDLAAPLASISSHYKADTRKVGGSMYRIYHDLRFAKDKTPYKTFAGARLLHERRREIAAPSFYIHIEPDACFAGGGLWHPETHTQRHIRHFIADNPAAWKRATQSSAFKQHFSFRGESLKRPPRGFDPEHALIKDLQRKSFAAVEALSESLACSPDLFDYLVETFKRVSPLVDYLCAAQGLDF